MTTKKDLKYYLNLDWTYTVESETVKGHKYFIIRVNELPGICTDAETLEEGFEDIKEAIEAAVKLYLKNGETVPEPIKKTEFKGNISYRTTCERHYNVAKVAKAMHKSISKTIDELVDIGMEKIRAI
ncbi:MAG: type II toxin-antitoxin system HicB family antitoxin [Chlamydiales bacterium]|nr:type II toxin-antitoxin system HicB family antitoxin [Chlamydiales bacterium]